MKTILGGHWTWSYGIASNQQYSADCAIAVLFMIKNFSPTLNFLKTSGDKIQAFKQQIAKYFKSVVLK